MKKTAIHAVILAFTVLPLIGQTVEGVVDEYRRKAADKIEKLNSTLEREGAAIAAGLISKGDTAGASQISEQVKAKLQNEAVLIPHEEVTTLFQHYDMARKTALNPLKEEGYKRLDSMLIAAGKDMAKVMDIGMAREKIKIDASDDASSPADFMAAHRLPKVWHYFLTPAMDVKYGTMVLNSDGTFSISTRDPVSGTWVPTKDPQVLQMKINTGAGHNETTVLKLEGDTAILRRATGERFLKAQL
jgi:hypothetical protein